MRLKSDEHDEKQLKCGVVGFLIGFGTAAAIVYLLLHHHQSIAAFLIILTLAVLLTILWHLDELRRDTVREVNKWRM
jgi:hypothetical protein